MRRLASAAAIAAVLACGTTAFAGDLSFKDTAVPAPIWSGPYIGGHAGGIWNKGRETSAESDWCRNSCIGFGPTDAVKFEDNGDDEVSLIGGLHVGRNWQNGSTVFGLEADLDFADGFDYLATARARLGYARGALLLYATAGVAFAGMDKDPFQFSTPQRVFDIHKDDERRIGFVVGGGVEYKVRSNWSFGVEGLYYGFGDEWNQYSSNFEVSCSGLCYENYRISESDDNDLWTIRARVTYHLTDDQTTEPLK